MHYEGVLLYELLQKAGVRFVDRSTSKDDGEETTGTLRTSIVLIEAADGYRIVYSVAEIHPDSVAGACCWRTARTASLRRCKAGLFKSLTRPASCTAAGSASHPDPGSTSLPAEPLKARLCPAKPCRSGTNRKNHSLDTRGVSPNCREP